MTEQEEDEELLTDLNQGKKNILSFDESPHYIKHGKMRDYQGCHLTPRQNIKRIKMTSFEMLLFSILCRLLTSVCEMLNSLPDPWSQLDDLPLRERHQRDPGRRDGSWQNAANHLPPRLHEALPKRQRAAHGPRAQVYARQLDE